VASLAAPKGAIVQTRMGRQLKSRHHYLLCELKSQIILQQEKRSLQEKNFKNDSCMLWRIKDRFLLGVSLWFENNLCSQYPKVEDDPQPSSNFAAQLIMPGLQTEARLRV
jgi:hypothetical protein